MLASEKRVVFPARVRREPVKTVGLAAGATFLLTGGPTRVLRRVRRAIWGPDVDLPKSLLPDAVERTLRRLGSDGDRVRGTIEREFAEYVGVAHCVAVSSATSVTAGRTINGLTVIEKGIRPGDKVVTDGQLRLVPGAKVEPKNPVEAAQS